jgi:hypothetical protein
VKVRRREAGSEFTAFPAQARNVPTLDRHGEHIFVPTLTRASARGHLDYTCI